MYTNFEYINYGAIILCFIITIDLDIDVSGRFSLARSPQDGVVPHGLPMTPCLDLVTATSLECIYCPSHTTQDECEEMNMTQICINETKCGYARFIEKRKDTRQTYPEDYNGEMFTVTVKKGCMDEDYCSVAEKKRGSVVNSSECIFCEEDLCILQFPLLCVECDEALEKFCPIQSEPMIKCPEGEVCYRQKTQTANFTEKRGCMDPSRCLKEDLCEYCETDICWTAPISLPVQQQLQEEKGTEKPTHTRKFKHNISSTINGNVSLVVFLLLQLINLCSD